MCQALYKHKPKIQSLPQRAHGPQRSPDLTIGGQNASFLTWLQFLLLLTGLFVLVALYPSLPVGTLPFPFPGFLFLYFFLKMLPTCLALCALLSILPVLFGTDIPTRLRSGRKGLNQGHGLLCQTCPFLVLVCFLHFAFQRTNANWSRCTMRFRKEHLFENKYIQPYRVCFVFMSLWWKTRPSVGWLSSLAVPEMFLMPLLRNRRYGDSGLEERLFLWSRTPFVGQLWFRPHPSMLSHQDAVAFVCFGLNVSAHWIIVIWLIILKII